MMSVADARARLDQRGLVRVLLLAVLLAGVVTMHAGVFALGGADEGHVGPSAEVIPTGATGMQDGADEPCRHHDGDCGNPHNAVHACVFVLTAAAILLGLAVLYWIGIDRVRSGSSTPRWRKRHRERAPPWTVLSLAELSILRI